MRPLTFASALAVAALPLAAGAVTISPSFDVFTADASIGAPAGATTALAGGNGPVGGTQEGPITITLPSGGILSISVTAVASGDVFEVIGNGVSLGTTSGVAYNSGALSNRTFVVNAGPGTYTIDSWDFVLSYVGANSPYGGFVDPALVPSPAQFTVDITVPEPATASLLPLALAGLVGIRRRRA